MSTVTAATIFTEIVPETFWGRRGIVKASQVWLMLAIIVTGMPQDGAIWKDCVLIFLAAASVSVASILVNDITDQPQDAASGKRRWIFALPRPAAIGIVTLLSCLGAIFVLMAGGTTAALLVYIGGIAFGMIYSLPPLRLKERGVLGLYCYSLATVLGYVALPWAWRGGPWWIPLVIGLAVFLDKWTNLHFHQVVDFDADARDGTKTYAIALGKERAGKTLKVVAFATTLLLIAATALVIFIQPELRVEMALMTIAAFIAIGIAVPGSKSTSLIRELPWSYLALTFILFRLAPLAVLASAAFRNPHVWPAFALCLAIMAVESFQSYHYRYE